MFDNKELTVIMSMVVNESVKLQKEINKCDLDLEKESLERDLAAVNAIGGKISKVINAELLQKESRAMNKDEWIVELTEHDYEIWGSDIDCCSREEAIEKGMEAAKKDGLTSFRIGKQEPCTMATIDVDTIIENAQEQLYDEVGEVSETYLESITKEQEKELEEALNEVFYNWHEKHKLFPSCYKVLDEEVIEVEHEDL